MPKRKSFPLRIDPDLYDDLRRWADAELRSVNGQIEYLLREAVHRHLGKVGRPKASGGQGGSEPNDPTDRGGRSG